MHCCYCCCPCYHIVTLLVVMLPLYSDVDLAPYRVMLMLPFYGDVDAGVLSRTRGNHIPSKVLFVNPSLLLSRLQDNPWSQVSFFPSAPRYLAFVFIAYKVKHSHRSSIFIEICQLELSRKPRQEKRSSRRDLNPGARNICVRIRYQNTIAFE